MLAPDRVIQELFLVDQKTSISQLSGASSIFLCSLRFLLLNLLVFFHAGRFSTQFILCRLTCLTTRRQPGSALSLTACARRPQFSGDGKLSSKEFNLKAQPF